MPAELLGIAIAFYNGIVNPRVVRLMQDRRRIGTITLLYKPACGCRAPSRAMERGPKAGTRYCAVQSITITEDAEFRLWRTIRFQSLRGLGASFTLSALLWWGSHV